MALANEEDMEAFFSDVVRYRPQELNQLASVTKFSRREIQHIYRGFKQECPLGTVDEDRFKHLFSQFFPFGDATKYAQFVFGTFCPPGTNIINFEEFLSSLSLVARGSLHDKIAWIFSLYDINHDGFITKHEMTEVVSAIYELLGHAIEPVLDAGSVERHVNAVFDLIDTNGDGVITLDEMERWCTRDEGNTKSLDMLNTVW
ncbi:calsenilin-like [Amphibalanus amphitrite]|uniref:calsenilin-like n=1 Tax=Amphibalanus amphitrite TaxID=1232801 RepID=UPI001C91C247|nr:calsenilin-like [Amphibalanus amphitrite]